MTVGRIVALRRIQGSKSDYQLVSEARLTYSLAFTATFYFQCRSAPKKSAPRGAPHPPQASGNTTRTTDLKRQVTARHHLGSICLETKEKTVENTIIVNISLEALPAAAATRWEQQCSEK